MKWEINWNVTLQGQIQTLTNKQHNDADNDKMAMEGSTNSTSALSSAPFNHKLFLQI